MNNVLDFADVSHWDDSNLDLHAYAASGRKIIGLKATEGMSNTDPTYQSVYGRARSVGLGVLSYAYILPGEGAGDIVHFESVAHLQSGDVQPVVDAEANGLGLATVAAAMHQLESGGFKPILYCSYAYWRDVLGRPSQWALWLADYSEFMPVLPTTVRLFAWQHTDKGTCPGVGAPCDMSKFLGGNLAEFLIP